MVKNICDYQGLNYNFIDRVVMGCCKYLISPRVTVYAMGHNEFRIEVWLNNNFILLDLCTADKNHANAGNTAVTFEWQCNNFYDDLPYTLHSGKYFLTTREEFCSIDFGEKTYTANNLMKKLFAPLDDIIDSIDPDRERVDI